MLEYSDVYKRIGERLVERMPEFEAVRDSGCRIAFLASDASKRSNGGYTLAECKRLTGDINKKFVPYDYLIIVYEPNIGTLSPSQLQVLLWHELKHINVVYKDGEYRFGITPHDLSDFKSLIERVGVNWDQEGENIPDIVVGEEDV